MPVHDYKLASTEARLTLTPDRLPYQLQGLAWLLDRENPALPAPNTNDSVQLWKRNARGGFTNIATNYSQPHPKLASGGILADDMGLGKTLQVISLILADPKKTREPTLIASPLSVMSNWSTVSMRGRMMLLAREIALLLHEYGC